MHILEKGRMALIDGFGVHTWKTIHGTQRGDDWEEIGTFFYIILFITNNQLVLVKAQDKQMSFNAFIAMIIDTTYNHLQDIVTINGFAGYAHYIQHWRMPWREHPEANVCWIGSLILLEWSTNVSYNICTQERGLQKGDFVYMREVTDSIVKGNERMQMYIQP